MKRPMTIAAITILAVVLLFACASTIRTGNTSIVTITIGGSQGAALLKAEAATPWTRLKHHLVDVTWVSEAYAYIPSIVQVLTVTVSAPDISTPIVGVSSVSSTQTTATLRIEVPNGIDRHFLVEGLRALPSGSTQTVFSGTNRTDLTGADVNLQIFMTFVGTGIYVNPSRPLSANTPTCGSSMASACATITHVLTTRPATTNNDVIVAMAGNYIPGTVAAIETFPLQLRPGMALLCTGTNFTSVIDVRTASQTAIRGNTDASVDNCKIISAPSAGIKSGVDDLGTRTKINGVSIELSGSPSVDQLIGVRLSNDGSLLLESTVTGVGASLSVYGAQVTAGRPSIVGNTISNLPYGIRLESGANSATIESNVFDLNQYGIWIVSSGSPRIHMNTIQFGSTGIYAAGGTPEITNNDINNNSFGIDVEIGSGVPRIQGNSLYCSSVADFFTNLSTPLDIRGNAWDHDPTTTPSGTFGPTDMISINGAFGCSGGVDICYQNTSPQPNYTSILPAVPNGCRFLP